MPPFARYALLALALAGCSGPAVPADPVAAGIRELTGARTRIAWVQGDDGDDEMRDTLALMGYDTDDGRGERRILPDLASYRKPAITPRGDRIVFSRRPTRPEGPEVLVVNWDGTELRSVTKGYALAVWQNPADGREWIYVGTDSTPDAPLDFATVTRVLLDDPSTRELVWNKTRVSSDTFHVAPDGRHVMGQFPWPHAGIAELPNGEFRKLGEGCWTSMTLVRGPLGWYFDGAHRNLTMVDMRTERRWTVNVSQVEGFGDAEVYHPRWTNHSRFMTMTGPYNLGGANQVRTGGPQSEVYLGRFNEDYTAVEAWTRATHNGVPDGFPDVWIDRQETPHRTAPAGRVGPAATQASGRGGSGDPQRASGRITVEARLVRAATIPAPRAIAPYQHALIVGLYDVRKVLDGESAQGQVLVAHWAIRDRRVLDDARRAPGDTFRLALEPFDAHPELEGERLILLDGAPDLPLLYEVPQS